MIILTRRDALKRGGAAAVILPIAAFPAIATAGTDPVIGLAQDWWDARKAARRASEALDAAAGNAHDAYPPVPRNLQRYRLRYDWDVEGGRREYIGPVTETDIHRWYKAQIATFGEKRIRPNYDRTMQRFREYEARKTAVDRRFNVPVLEKRDNDAWQRVNELEVLIVRTPARTVRGLADKMQVMATTYLPTGYAEMPDDELDDEQRMMLAVVQDSLQLAEGAS